MTLYILMKYDISPGLRGVYGATLKSNYGKHMKNLINFLKAYIKSMRLYYAFVTGIAGWLGVSFYEFLTDNYFPAIQITPSPVKKIFILVMLFLGWGLNQIFNDYLGLKEDRINAPHRPMVTGKLNVKGALALSSILLVCASIGAWFFLEPISLIPLWMGILLNIVYEFAKGYGIWGNIIFGLMISMCAAFGFLASGPYAPPLFTPNRMAILALVWLINSLMTYFTYFKDYEGDMKAGKKTIVVKYGIQKAKWIGIVSSFLPAIAFSVFYSMRLWPEGLSTTFWILATLTVFLELWTAYLYYKNPEGERTYFSLATNFRACACGQAAFIAVFNDQLALLLFLVTYIFVGFLFDLHTDARG